MKTCITKDCNESDPKRFYVFKKTGKAASRCMACARKQVLRRYHTVTKLKTREARARENAVLYGVSA